MTVRNILVPVRGDGKHEALLDHALVLARRFNAHIDVVHCRPRADDMLPFGVVVPDSVREHLARSADSSGNEDEKKLRAAFDLYCEDHSLPIVDRHAAPSNEVSVSWREERGKQPAVVGRLGRLTDIIMVPRPDRKRNLGYGTLEAGLFETGHLVLMCPTTKAEKIGDHIAIGWSGTTEAARAVSIALPILEAASQVTLLGVDTDHDRPLGLDDLELYLGTHGIGSSCRRGKADSHHVGQTLLKEAAKVGADSLLIGAYGQNRLRELVMGGVTRHLIDHADIPVFMTH
jgi:nucleotide-binding universal stress UspA family protein